MFLVIWASVANYSCTHSHDQLEACLGLDGQNSLTHMSGNQPDVSWVAKVTRPCVTHHLEHPGTVHMLVTAGSSQGPKGSEPLCASTLQVSVCLTGVIVSLVKVMVRPRVIKGSHNYESIQTLMHYILPLLFDPSHSTDSFPLSTS